MAPTTNPSTIVDPFADHRWSESSRAPPIEVRDVTVSFGAYTAIQGELLVS